MTGVLVAGIITDLSDWLEDISGHWWFLLVILVIAFFDSVIPIVPSETTVIIGGVAAGLGNQRLLLVIAAGAIGAFLGDNTAYLIGRRMSAPIERWAAQETQTRWPASSGPTRRSASAAGCCSSPPASSPAGGACSPSRRASPDSHMRGSRRGSGWPR